MAASTPNVPLLKRTLAHIETNQNRWYQAEWVREIEEVSSPECGMAYCFGGWAIVLHGATILPGDPYYDDEGADYVRPLAGETGWPEEWLNPDADPGEIEAEILYYATWLLGLTAAQRELFSEHNTLGDLRRIVADLCGEAGR